MESAAGPGAQHISNSHFRPKMCAVIFICIFFLILPIREHHHSVLLRI